MLGVSWWGAGVLVIKPISERRDFCSGKAKTCLKTKLEQYQLTDVKIEVVLNSFDNTQLKGLYLPSRNGAAVIVQHGYGNHAGSVLHIANMLYQQGYGVLTMDLRTHGRSEGELVTFGRDEAKDMQYAFDYLVAREDVNPEKIGIYGWSLGGATVLIHGANNPGVKAVVADSPFDAINYENMKEFIDLPWPMPSIVRFFTSVRSGVDFDKDSPMTNISAYRTKPLFIMIAGKDTVVDHNSGERIVTAINAMETTTERTKDLIIWREPNYKHVRFSFNAPEKFSKDVGAFFKKHLHPMEFQKTATE